ncbi:MAG: TraR/DksA C4-type zinc finger protein [Chitinophagaceae bacterium]|nr:TraR/DksA C4-type zinc finger protein [Chitinophagaceae bacterium]
MATQKKKVVAKSATKKNIKTAAKKSSGSAKSATGNKKAGSKKDVKKNIKSTGKKAVTKKAPSKNAQKVSAKKAVKKTESFVKNKVTAESKKKVITKATETVNTPKPEVKKVGETAQIKKEKETNKIKEVVIPKTTTTSSVKYEPEFTRSILDNPEPQPQPATPIVRYSDAELAEFKELILKKLEAAKKELVYLQGLITRKDESGDIEDARYMTMEDGSISMEREQLSQMASRQITYIDHLEKALMRIENKTYGICRVTGKLIDKARLRAVPHATLSIEAKQMMNK